MKLPGLVGRCSMEIASKVRQTKPTGVIVSEHTLSASQTRLHVETFSRWFDFIHYTELLDRLSRPRARPFCLLTFDDGKRSNATETAPELERMGVPAVFYVTTGFLTDGFPLWFDRADAIRRSLGYTPPELEEKTLKQLPFTLLKERLDQACANYRVTTDMACDDIRPMTWKEARELARRGFTLGAHGLRHAVLTCETEADALFEIRQSIEEVRTEVGECLTFAFPNGNYTKRLAHHALECGVETVVTTEPMWVDSRFPPWRLPRVQFFDGDSRAKIELKLAVAASGRLLTNPDGTGRRYRKYNGSNCPQ
ncbi:MAG: polysaccharide deacetylase family protein [Acidobacteria bacterium]|nr:polysaccharide deacetylase family protein [Acidobacteriota bacterium]